METKITLLASRLGLDYSELKKDAVKKRLDLSLIQEILETANSRGEAWERLRSEAQMSYQAIADASSVSRQCVHQTIGKIDGVPRSKKRQPGQSVLEQVKNKIYKEAATSPTVWTKSGRLKRLFVMTNLIEAGFSQTVASKVAGSLKKPKAGIVMFGVLDLPFDEHHDWLVQQQEAKKPQVRVWENINNRTPVKLSQMAFCRYCHSIGVSERKDISGNNGRV